VADLNLKQPEAERIVFRVGLHLGDLMSMATTFTATV
jgi:hypothetical protein